MELSTAKQLGEQGVTVVLGSRKLSDAEAAAAKLKTAGVDAYGIQLDVTKAADRNAAFLESTRLVGFALAEARRFFGQPPKFSAALERDYLTPWPAETAEARYRERFVKLTKS